MDFDFECQCFVRMSRFSAMGEFSGQTTLHFVLCGKHDKKKKKTNPTSCIVSVLKKIGTYDNK